MIECIQGCMGFVTGGFDLQGAQFVFSGQQKINFISAEREGREDG